MARPEDSTDPLMPSVPPDEPGVALSVLFFAVYAGLLGLAFSIDPDMAGRDNHPLAEACIFATFVWTGLWVGLANRIPHKSWFFRLWIGLAKTTGRPIRDPVILDVIGPGLALIGLGMVALRVWQYAST